MWLPSKQQEINMANNRENNRESNRANVEYSGRPVECSAHDIIVDDSGWTTAELLGNAALGILALVVIWGVLQALGVNVVEWIGGQLGVA